MCVCVCVCVCARARMHTHVVHVTLVLFTDLRLSRFFSSFSFFFFWSQRVRDKTIKNAAITEFRYASLMIGKFSVAQVLAFAYSHITSQGLYLDRKGDARH